LIGDYIIKGIAAVVAVFGVWFFTVGLPLFCYNIAWGAFRSDKPVVPLYWPGYRAAHEKWFELTGRAVKLYGVFAAICGLSLNLFVFDFIYNYCGDCKATTYQSTLLFVFLFCMFAVAASKTWVPSFSKTAYVVREEGELFFWDGFFKLLARKLGFKGKGKKKKSRKR
jgi:hypothetical protein